MSGPDPSVRSLLDPWLIPPLSGVCASYLTFRCVMPWCRASRGICLVERHLECECQNDGIGCQDVSSVHRHHFHLCGSCYDRVSAYSSDCPHFHHYHEMLAHF